MLSSAEEAELRRRAGKYTLPYFQVQRAKMILHAAEGMPNVEIAARLASSAQVRVLCAPVRLFISRSR